MEIEEQLVEEAQQTRSGECGRENDDRRKYEEETSEVSGCSEAAVVVSASVPGEQAVSSEEQAAGGQDRVDRVAEDTTAECQGSRSARESVKPGWFPSPSPEPTWCSPRHRSTIGGFHSTSATVAMLLSHIYPAIFCRTHTLARRPESGTCQGLTPYPPIGTGGRSADNQFFVSKARDHSHALLRRFFPLILYSESTNWKIAPPTTLK